MEKEEETKKLIKIFFTSIKTAERSKKAEPIISPAYVFYGFTLSVH
jgi:hypothetical protein